MASSSAATPSAVPSLQYAVNPSHRNCIIVSPRQKGNPVLSRIRNVRWVFADIVPDYLVGESACALYISLRYHLLHPDYLFFRIRELQKSFRLRVVLCHIDVDDVTKPLHDITKTALLHECTLLCAWTVDECARYLETLKTYEKKSADPISERIENDYFSRLTAALTSVRSVNRKDAVTLATTFGSLADVMRADVEELARCPGIGDKKVRRLHDAFHQPFRRRPRLLPAAAEEGGGAAEGGTAGGGAAGGGAAEGGTAGGGAGGEEAAGAKAGGEEAAGAKAGGELRGQQGGVVDAEAGGRAGGSAAQADGVLAAEGGGAAGGRQENAGPISGSSSSSTGGGRGGGGGGLTGHQKGEEGRLVQAAGGREAGTGSTALTWGGAGKEEDDKEVRAADDDEYEESEDEL